MAGGGLGVGVGRADCGRHGVGHKMGGVRGSGRQTAGATVAKGRKDLTKHGTDGWCWRHSGDSCALRMGACPCGMMASSGKPVCNECKGGWAAGDGAIPGKSADDIKALPRMDMSMSGKMGQSHAKGEHLVVLRTCQMKGEKVVGGGAGMSRVGNYDVH